MSRLTKKKLPSSFSIRTDTHRVVQPQNIGRGLILGFKVKGVYYLCDESRCSYDASKM